jgi:hypothetical protein
MRTAAGCRLQQLPDGRRPDRSGSPADQDPLAGDCCLQVGLRRQHVPRKKADGTSCHFLRYGLDTWCKAKAHRQFLQNRETKEYHMKRGGSGRGGAPASTIAISVPLMLRNPLPDRPLALGPALVHRLLRAGRSTPVPGDGAGRMPDTASRSHRCSSGSPRLRGMSHVTGHRPWQSTLTIRPTDSPCPPGGTWEAPVVRLPPMDLCPNARDRRSC